MGIWNCLHGKGPVGNLEEEEQPYEAGRLFRECLQLKVECREMVDEVEKCLVCIPKGPD